MSREIPIAFEELAEITARLSGRCVNEYLIEFTETVALFAATSEVTADETSTLLPASRRWPMFRRMRL